MREMEGPWVRPLGGEVRRLRHERGWSPRALLSAIEGASRVATGVGTTLTPDELAGIEERDEALPYEALCLVASGLDCDPVDLLREELGAEPPRRRA